MTRPNEYAEIQQDLLNAQKMQPWDHEMGTTDYCVFLTPDTTSGGAAVNLATFYSPLNTRTASTVEVYDGYAVDTYHYDMLLVTAHSMLDVGPITGQTRGATAADIFRPGNVYLNRPAYRSLHRVTFYSALETTYSDKTPVLPVGPADANLGYLTHRLATGNVAVFATPSSMPIDNGVAVKVFWQPALTNGSLRIQLWAVKDNGSPFSPQPGSFTFDIMVVSRPEVGHSTVYHDNRRYVASVPPLSVRPDYRAFFRGEIISANPTPLLHNDLKRASMALFGFSEKIMTSAIGCPAVPFIQQRGTGGTILTTTTVNNAGATMQGIDALIVSPHSIFTSRVV
jgi:hypothetical protein